MSYREVTFCLLFSFFIGFFSLVANFLEVFLENELSDITVVVGLHFEIEDFVFRNHCIRNKLIIQQINNIITILLEFFLNLMLKLFDVILCFSLLLALFLLLDC